MNDRSGNKYHWLVERKAVRGFNSLSSAEPPKPGQWREVRVCLVSPARQERKAFAASVGGITGRQWKKYRKAQSHLARRVVSRESVVGGPGESSR